MAASSSPTNEFINSRSEEFINYLFLTVICQNSGLENNPGNNTFYKMGCTEFGANTFEYYIMFKSCVTYNVYIYFIIYIFIYLFIYFVFHVIGKTQWLTKISDGGHFEK